MLNYEYQKDKNRLYSLCFFSYADLFIGASIINNLFVISGNKSEEISPKTVKTSDLIIDLFRNQIHGLNIIWEKRIREVHPYMNM